jgi:hypothetical protein
VFSCYKICDFDDQRWVRCDIIRIDFPRRRKFQNNFPEGIFLKGDRALPATCSLIFSQSNAFFPLSEYLEAMEVDENFLKCIASLELKKLSIINCYINLSSQVDVVNKTVENILIRWHVLDSSKECYELINLLRCFKSTKSLT